MSMLHKIKNKKKFIIPAVILCIVMIAAIVMSQFDMPGGSSGGIPVSAGSVEKMDVTQELSVKGVVRGEKYAELYGPSGSKIEEVLVAEGDAVSKDQLLMALKTGENEQPRSQAALEAAKMEYEAAKKLYEAGGMSRVDFLKAKGAYENASYTASLVERIKSPFSGTVTRVNGVTGSVLEAGVPAVVVEDLSNLQMKVKISEYDINDIKIGQDVVISSEVIGERKLDGKVVAISPTGERKDSTSTEMVIPVTIAIDKADSKLISGVTAKAKIILAVAQNAMTVPVDAVLQDPKTEKYYVLAIENGATKKVPVELGVEGDFNVQTINTELKEGAQVVLSPELDMADGTKVYVAPAM